MFESNGAVEIVGGDEKVYSEGELMSVVEGKKKS